MKKNECSEVSIYKILPDRLVPWFEKNKRDLAWRIQPTPYRVWVSEIMLQQTRVEAVKPYYDRFMQALPDLPALADANEEILLKLWEGLGYYRRVKMMQKTARIIMEQYEGVFPSTYENVRALPGIGDYTAGAILSIAFGQPIPAVDGNVLRVIMRVLACKDNIDDPKTKQNVSIHLQKIYPVGKCGEFTQSLMELGAMVCLPHGDPLCNKCPMHGICGSEQNELWEKIPVHGEKASRVCSEFDVLVMHYHGLIAIRKRPDNGLLAGLWEFPNTELKSVKNIRMLKKTFGLRDLELKKTAKHVFTHREWHLQIFWAEAKEQYPDYHWVTPEQLRTEFSIPSAFRAAIQVINQAEKDKTLS